MVAGFFLIGCSGDPGPEASQGSVAAPRPGGTTAAPGTTKPRWDAKQQEVVDAFTSAVGLMHEAERSGNDPGARLDDLFAEPFKTELKAILDDDRAAGRLIRQSPLGLAHVDIESVTFTDPTTATLVDCDVDDYVLYDGPTGSVLDDSVNTGHRTETLIEDSGDWKWSKRVIDAKSEGVSGCALTH
jgi:hypothetical protein